MSLLHSQHDKASGMLPCFLFKKEIVFSKHVLYSRQKKITNWNIFWKWKWKAVFFLVIKRNIDLILNLETKFQEWRLVGFGVQNNLKCHIKLACCTHAASSMFVTRKACSRRPMERSNSDSSNHYSWKSFSDFGIKSLRHSAAKLLLSGFLLWPLLPV